MLISIVTPAYNEAQNLPLMHERLARALKSLVPGLEWEWVVIDDHSADATFAVAAEIARLDPRVRAYRLARNFGSHGAIACGLHHAGGQGVVVMASDLQDPPELLPQLVEKWRAGAQVVWAVRGERVGETWANLAFSRAFFFIMRRLAGIRNIPPTGADFLLLDRRVVDELGRFRERNTHLLALISWMGFRQDSITYAKQARAHGRSGWSFEKKVKNALDAITSFTYLPVRAITYAGLAVGLTGFAFAVYSIFHMYLSPVRPPEGYTSLMVAILVLGGGQMVMLGVLGEYIWRGLDESRRRPAFLVEEATAGAAAALEPGGARAIPAGKPRSPEASIGSV